jgi:hypothetical protein
VADTRHGPGNPLAKKLAVALVLNRADWLEEMQYTIPEAIEPSGVEWVAIVPQVARQLAEEE